MSRTFIRQDTQIRNSDLYDDTLGAGTALESAATEIEYDLNAIRSQQKRALFADAAGDWWADIPTVNGKKRAIGALNLDLDDLEEKKLLFRAQILTDIVVGAGVNYKILSLASSETPTVVRAVALTQNGAVTAASALNGGAFAAHELTEIAGQNAISPKNLCVVRDASNGQPIQSAGRDVYALLQGESTGADGSAFNDVSTGNRAKLSFVRMNAALDDLEAVPSADIAGKTINYIYVRRINFDAIPEDSFLGDAAFIDQTASVDVTLQNAINNQSGPVTQSQNIEVRVADTFTWAFTDSTGAAKIFEVAPLAGGDEVRVNVALLDINNTLPVDMSGALKVATGGTEIDLGVTPGTIGTTGANDLRINGAGELLLDDGNQTGSTWAQTTGIKLSETTAEWDAFEAAYGEVSLLSALVAAKNVVTPARNAKVYANVTTTTNADVDVGGTAGGTNLDAQLPNMSAGNFLTDYDVFLNGTLLRPGVNSGANHDYYPGTSLALGQLKFEFKVKAGSRPDVICVIPYN